MSMIARRIEDIQDEIRDNARDIHDLKEEMVKIRKRANLNPKSEKEAEEMRTDKEWLSANSTFKFLQRLGVLD